MNDKPKTKPKKTHPWRVFHPPRPRHINQQDYEDLAVPANHNPLRRRSIK